MKFTGFFIAKKFYFVFYINIKYQVKGETMNISPIGFINSFKGSKTNFNSKQNYSSPKVSIYNDTFEKKQKIEMNAEKKLEVLRNKVIELWQQKAEGLAEIETRRKQIKARAFAELSLLNKEQERLEEKISAEIAELQTQMNEIRLDSEEELQQID